MLHGPLQDASRSCSRSKIVTEKSAIHAELVMITDLPSQGPRGDRIRGGNSHNCVISGIVEIIDQSTTVGDVIA